MLDVMERSLGPAASHAIIDSRSRLIDLARSEEIRVPETFAIATVDQLRAWLSQHGLPAVLKADETSGGVGVRIIHTAEAVEQAIERMSVRPATVHAGKQALFKRDPTLFVSSLHRRKLGVNVQRFIEGSDATSSVACWKGQIIASIRCEVLKTMYPMGPASVLRVIDNHEMDQSAERLIRRLGLSGIYGFDFRLEAHTGKAHLIEMNARATQISHLAMGAGRNLPAALHAMLSGEPVPQTKRITEKDIIVLFPQEWSKDPFSEFLTSGFHDVPWREPGLVKFCIDNYLPDSKCRLEARSKHLLQMLYNKIRQH
jgi:biotin carboxylase